MASYTWDEAVDNIYQEFWGNTPISRGTAAYNKRIDRVINRLMDTRHYKSTVIDFGVVIDAFEKANNKRSK